MTLCTCGSPMGLKAKTCKRCRELARYQRRKLRMSSDATIHAPIHRESTDRVERLLALVDAQKRRTRWAA